MKKWILIPILLFLVLKLEAQQTYKRVTKQMGCRFEITVIADSPREGEQFIDIAVEEISRIEQLISSWDTNSQTSLVNKYAGIKPVQVDRELFELIERALSISKLTDGAFDISCAGLNKVWRFDGSMSKVPLPKVVEESIRKINYQNISTNKENRTIFLKERGMKIGFGAIGKGYAADMAKALLIKKGVKSGIINASGDMTTWGRQPNGKEWTVAITNPMNKSQSFALLPITNGAVVTSGDYERFVEIDGKKYAHIIDPKTGYPAKGIISVTVFAPKAELADALATSVFVMGIEAGLNRINQLPKVECIIIDAGGKIHKSENIKIEKI